MTKTFSEQKQLIKKINDIFSSKKYDAAKKMRLFTSDVCLPEIMKSNNTASTLPDDIFLNVSNDKDKKVIPYVCFFNGLNFLQRQPTIDDYMEPGKKLDLEKGFKMKDTFIALRQENDGTKCQTDLQ